MVHFLIGRAGTGKTTRVREQIQEEILHGTRDVVLLVPEQQTVIWETAMAELLPPSANFRLEITNFTRLANSVFRVYGGLADSVVDAGTRALLIWRAMQVVWEQLTVYNHCASGREDRNIPHLMAAVDELKNSGVSPAEVEAALEALQQEGDGGQGDLTARLSDAVLVYAAYNELLHETHIDRGDLLYNLADCLAHHPYFAGKVVFIDSFFSLTMAEERILGWIMKQAAEVTMTFACPPTQNTDGVDELQFLEVRRYLRKAASLANRAGQPIERVTFEENLRHRNAAELAWIERYLFDYAAELPTSDGKAEMREAERVQLIRCADVYDEAEACAAVVERLLREGYRYADIAIVARDMKTRRGIVDTVLKRHGVRYFLAETTDVASLPAVRFVLATLAVASHGWDRADVIRLVKTGLTAVGKTTAAEETDTIESAETECAQMEMPIDDTERPAMGINAALEGDVLELYAETWNIRGRKMFTGGPWAMNPAGYKVERTEVGEEMLRLANAAREKLIPPLEECLSVFDAGTASVREVAERLVAYAQACHLDEGLGDIVKRYRALGMKAEAEKARTSWDKVCEILDCMVENLGDTVLDAGRFAGLFARVASAMDVGAIPTGIDEITLGSASGVRFDGIRCVILLGAVEGEFPGAVTESSGFFGDRDRERLEAVGLTLGMPDRDEQTAREYFMFYRTVASAQDRLYILTSSAENEKLSEGALRVRDLLARQNLSCSKLFAEMPLSEIVFHRDTAEYLLSKRNDPTDKAVLRALVQTDGADARLVYGEERVRVDAICSIEGTDSPGRMTLTQSKIEAFVQCPLQYWCKYEMKLRPQAQADIRTPDIGTFLHAVLEQFFSSLTPDQLDRMPLERSESERIADGIMERYRVNLAKSGLGVLDSEGDAHLDGRLDYLFLRLRRHVYVFLDAIMTELAQSKFRPIGYEVPIGMRADASRENAVQVAPLVMHTEAGTEVVLRGIADRIDVYRDENGQDFVRVIDYKTGSKIFSLDDVSRGLNVQLLLYLFSIWKNGMKNANKYSSYAPAGAMYVQAKPASLASETFVSEQDALSTAIGAVERSGVYLQDETILRAMEENLGEGFIKAKFDESGAVKKTGKGTELLSREDFAALSDTLEEVIGKIATEMENGRADADPLESGGRSPCDWCEHRTLCRKKRT